MMSISEYLRITYFLYKIYFNINFIRLVRLLCFPSYLSFLPFHLSSLDGFISSFFFSSLLTLFILFIFILKLLLFKCSYIYSTPVSSQVSGSRPISTSTQMNLRSYMYSPPVSSQVSGCSSTSTSTSAQMNLRSYIHSRPVSSQVSGCPSTSTSTSTQMNLRAESQPVQLQFCMQVIPESTSAYDETENTEAEQESEEVNNHNGGIFYFYSTTYDYI